MTLTDQKPRIRGFSTPPKTKRQIDNLRRSRRARALAKSEPNSMAVSVRLPLSIIDEVILDLRFEKDIPFGRGEFRDFVGSVIAELVKNIYGGNGNALPEARQNWRKAKAMKGFAR